VNAEGRRAGREFEAEGRRTKGEFNAEGKERNAVVVAEMTTFNPFSLRFL
jgi:hypothetical protein